MLLGCRLGVYTQDTQAVSSGWVLEVLYGVHIRGSRSGYPLQIQPWAVSAGCELEVLSRCELGVHTRGAHSGYPLRDAILGCELRLRARGALGGALREAGGAAAAEVGGPPLLGGAVPPHGGFPAEGCLFQEMAFACGSCYRNERFAQARLRRSARRPAGRGGGGAPGLNLGGVPPQPPGRGCGVTSPSPPRRAVPR